MWCAGEIATTVANNVRIRIVGCDDYMHPDEAYLRVLEKAWSEEEVHARYIECVLTPDLPRILSRL